MSAILAEQTSVLPDNNRVSFIPGWDRCYLSQNIQIHHRPGSSQASAALSCGEGKCSILVIFLVTGCHGQIDFARSFDKVVCTGQRTFLCQCGIEIFSGIEGCQDDLQAKSGQKSYGEEDGEGQVTV